MHDHAKKPLRGGSYPGNFGAIRTFDHRGAFVTRTNPLPTRTAPLAEAVRGRRVELDLTQAELADLAGCSQRFVHTVEQGKPTLRLDKLLDVLEVLGLGLSVGPGDGAITAVGGGAHTPHAPLTPSAPESPE